MGVILVVDGYGDVARSVADAFGGKGGFHAVIESRTGRSGLSILQESVPIDVAVISDRLADMDGIELLASLKRLAPSLEVILAGGNPSVEAYLKAVNAGAFEFIARPIGSPLELRRIMIAAMEESALARYRSRTIYGEKRHGPSVAAG